jgi:ribosomal protein S18 acetylase RimI-like enzyme
MEIRPPRNPVEHRFALARLIDRSGLADPLVAERVEVLEAYTRKRGLSLEHCLIVAEGDHIEAVCLSLDSQGRTSSLLLSPGITAPRLRSVAGELLARTQSRAAERGVQLLQGMVAPESSDEAILYAASGMKHLANLIYMQSDCQHMPSHPSDVPLRWETYRNSTHELFKRVIEQTYEDSLDCGSLNGVRDIEDIIASHKATGLFEPQLWRIGMVGEEPVGVILLGYMEEQHAYELVYMGILPAFRKRGYGAAILRHGMTLVLSRGVSLMSVSVDEKNAPAQKLYHSFGFREIMRRGVWIRILPPDSAFQR